jgi:hypothetical protein
MMFKIKKQKEKFQIMCDQKDMEEILKALFEATNKGSYPAFLDFNRALKEMGEEIAKQKKGSE